MYTAADRESVAAGEVSAQDRLLARLKPYVPQKRWSGKNRVKVLSDGALALDLSGLEVADLSMLRGTGVRELNLGDTNIGDLALLRGLKLSRLDLTRTSVTDLEPLSAMPLEYLQLLGSRIETLEPLRGMPVRELHADAPSLQDFAALGSLRQLEVLTLPVQAAGVDLAGATALRTVAHARFQPASPLTAEHLPCTVRAQRRGVEALGSGVAGAASAGQNRSGAVDGAGRGWCRSRSCAAPV